MRAFARVAQLRSFVAAAAELSLTPSAISLQIKELELAAGMPLLVRDARTVSLTEAGELLLVDVRRALQAVQHADDALRGLSERAAARVRVGMLSGAEIFLPRLLAQFREQHRGVELQLVVGNRDKLLGHLRDGEVDLAIMGSPPGGLQVRAEPFAALPLGVVAAPQHELARARAVQPSMLAQYEFILREPGSGTRAALERYIHEQKLALPRRREMGSNGDIKQAVMANLGLAFMALPAAALELRGGLLVAVDVVGLPLVRRWFVIDADVTAHAEAAAALRRFILERGAEGSLMMEAPIQGAAGLQNLPGGQPAALH